MKKVLTLALAVMMLCGVCLAEDMEGERMALGIWDLEMITDADGNVLDTDFPFSTVGIYNDFTGFFDVGDLTGDGTWEENEDGTGFILNIEGDLQGFLVDPETGYLIWEDPEDGSRLIFAPHVDLPALINAEGLEDFQGTWIITGVLQYGLYGDLTGETEETLMAVFGTAEPAIVIDGENVNILSGLKTGTAQFTDGALLVENEDGVFNICMTEDGGIACDGDNGVITTYYAVKQ